MTIRRSLLRTFNLIRCAGMAVFKLGVNLLNLVPYLALKIVGWAEVIL